MAWVRLSDAGGGCEVTLFSEVLSRCRDLLIAGHAVLVHAELKLDGDALRITAQDVVDLERAAAQEESEIRVWVDQPEAARGIQALLSDQKGGKGRIVLVPAVTETTAVEVALRGRYPVTPRLGEMLRAIPGVQRVDHR